MTKENFEAFEKEFKESCLNAAFEATGDLESYIYKILENNPFSKDETIIVRNINRDDFSNISFEIEVCVEKQIYTIKCNIIGLI